MPYCPRTPSASKSSFKCYNKYNKLAIKTENKTKQPLSEYEKLNITKERCYNVGSTNRNRHKNKTDPANFLAKKQINAFATSQNNQKILETYLKAIKSDKTESNIFCKEKLPFESTSFLTYENPDDLKHLNNVKEDIGNNRRETEKLDSLNQLVCVYSQTHHLKPDVLLFFKECKFLLHSSVIEKCKFLKNVLREDTDNSVFISPLAEALDTYIQNCNFYSNEYKKTTKRLTTAKDSCETSNNQIRSSMKTIKLKVSDEKVSVQGVTMALLSLYCDIELSNDNEVSSVLPAASVLNIDSLVEKSENYIINNLNVRNFCMFIKLSLKYTLEAVTTYSKRWLELNLIGNLSSSFQLKNLPMQIFEKVISSSNLFTYKEYAVYKTLCYWVYYQFHKKVENVPTQIAVFSYFSTHDKSKPFLHREKGEKFQKIFNLLRLQGITEVDHIQEIIHMNIFPENKLQQLINNKYQTLMKNGEMSVFVKFSQFASRFGIILNKNCSYESQSFQFYSFHFELVAMKNENGMASIYFTLITDNELALENKPSYRPSSRKDRKVRYEILAGNINRRISSGVLEKNFSVVDKKSKELKVEVDELPIHISLHLMFPLC